MESRFLKHSFVSNGSETQEKLPNGDQNPSSTSFPFDPDQSPAIATGSFQKQRTQR